LTVRENENAEPANGVVASKGLLCSTALAGTPGERGAAPLRTERVAAKAEEAAVSDVGENREVRVKSGVLGRTDDGRRGQLHGAAARSGGETIVL
jgi:hypothetical protein